MFGATDQRPRRERTLGRLVMRSLDAVLPEGQQQRPPACSPPPSPGQPEQLRARPGRRRAPPPTSRAARTSRGRRPGRRRPAPTARRRRPPPARRRPAARRPARRVGHATAPGTAGAAGPRWPPAAGPGRRPARARAARTRPAFRAASACGTVSGSSLRALAVDELVVGTNTTGRSAGLTGSRTALGRTVGRRPGEGQPAEQAGRDVVRVPLQLGGQRQQRVVVERVGAAEHQRPGGGEPGHDRGRGRAEAATVRDPVRAAPPRGRAAGRRARRRRPAGPARPGAGGYAGRCRRPPRPRRRTGPSSVTRTTTSSYRLRARPSASKPGPRLALVAGTRTRTGRPGTPPGTLAAPLAPPAAGRGRQARPSDAAAASRRPGW